MGQFFHSITKYFLCPTFWYEAMGSDEHTVRLLIIMDLPILGEGDNKYKINKVNFLRVNHILSEFP